MCGKVGAGRWSGDGKTGLGSSLSWVPVEAFPSSPFPAEALTLCSPSLGRLPSTSSASLHPAAPLIAEGPVPVSLLASHPELRRLPAVDLGGRQLGSSGRAQQGFGGLGQGLGKTAEEG